MSERFGMSHRATVRDVNEGKVVPEKPAAPTSARGIGAVRPARQDQTVTVDDGTQRLVRSLVNAAGNVGAAVQKEIDRKNAIRGYNWAGTKKGREEVDEASGQLGALLFGPNPKLRSAQERIVKDQTDQAATKLYLDLEDFGHKMTDAEWEQHVADELGARLDKFDDEGIKDQITMRFGQNLTAVAREREKAHHMFLQNEERETFMDSVLQSADMAENDLYSGDPNRQRDAVQRLKEGLQQPEGMTDTAYRSAILSTVKNQLANGRGALYAIAKDAGVFDDLEVEEREELETQKGIFDAENDQQYILAMQELEYIATTTGDIGQVTALAQRLQGVNPQLFANGIAPVVEMAFDRQMEIQEEARRRHAAEVAYGAGTGLSESDEPQKQMAAEDYLNTMADRWVREDLKAKYEREGKIMPDDVEITAAAKNEALLKNSDKWARTWATNQVVTDRVKQMGLYVANNIDRIDMTREQAEELRSQLDSMMVLQRQSPDLWAKHFDNETAGRLMTLHTKMSFEGADPFEVMARERELERVRARGIDFKLSDAARETAAEDVGDAFVRMHGDWSVNPLRHGAGLVAATGTAVLEGLKAISPFHDGEASNIPASYKNLAKLDPQLRNQLDTLSQMYYEEAYARTGDAAMAQAEAVNRLNRGSLIIGRDSIFQTGKFVLEGQRLNEKSYGGDFDRYLEGIDASEVDRRQLILDYNLPEDFSLRSGNNRYVAYPDGSGAGIWLKNANGEEVMVPIEVPTRPEHILPTAGEQRVKWVREQLEKSRGMGSEFDVMSAGQPQQ